ncbi:MAG: 2-oxoacid:acceptor oxidoreductase family protein [Sedimentisphaerales bacterium]|nr:2-oxoacid:acceptor oxidoreductase family protein [Sedimentisphaerales bacterium]
MIETSLYEQVIIAGFGGQGVILAGKLLAQMAMTAGHEVTYMPSYGAEVRGGTANSMVVIADEPIAAPLVTIPDVAIILNAASFHKFTPHLKTGGLLILNSSMVQETVERDDIEVVAVPVDDIANNLDSPRSANMAAIGAYLQKHGLMNPDLAAQCLPDVLAQRYHKTIPVNTQAIQKGAEYVREHYS